MFLVESVYQMVPSNRLVKPSNQVTQPQQTPQLDQPVGHHHQFLGVFWKIGLWYTFLFFILIITLREAKAGTKSGPRWFSELPVKRGDSPTEIRHQPLHRNHHHDQSTIILMKALPWLWWKLVLINRVNQYKSRTVLDNKFSQGCFSEIFVSKGNFDHQCFHHNHCH